MNQIRTYITQNKSTCWEFFRKDGYINFKSLEIGNFSERNPCSFFKNILLLNAIIGIRNGAELSINTKNKQQHLLSNIVNYYIYFTIIKNKLLIHIGKFKKDSPEFLILKSNFENNYLHKVQIKKFKSNETEFILEIPINSEYFDCKKYLMCSMVISHGSFYEKNSKLKISLFILNKKTSNDFIFENTHQEQNLELNISNKHSLMFLKNISFNSHILSGELQNQSKKNDLCYSDIFSIIRTIIAEYNFSKLKKSLETNSESNNINLLPLIASGIFDLKNIIKNEFLIDQFSDIEEIKNFVRISVAKKEKNFSPPRRTKAKVKFLLDREYFFTLRNLLIAVKDGGFEKNLSKNKDTFSDANQYIDNLLLEIAKKNIKISLIMWDPRSFLSKVSEFNLITKAGEQLKDSGIISNLISKNRIDKSSKQQNIKIFLEKYGVKLGSQHQKIAIIKINNKKFAIVGGLNLVTPPYFDEITHPMESKDDYGNLNFHTWHDSAVIVDDDIASQIEEEFDRRWSKSNYAPIDKNDSSYVKLAYWRFKDRSCLYSNNIKNYELKNCDIKNLSINAYVKRLITNFEGKNDITEIKDAILHNIEKSKKHIFFENYAFHDLEIIKNLANRVKTSDKDFRVVIMLPFQTYQVNDIMQTLENKIFFLSFIALKILSEDWDEIVLENERKIKKDDINFIKFDDSELITNQTTKISKIIINYKSREKENIDIKKIKDIYNKKHNNEAFGKIIACSPVRRIKLPKLNSQEYKRQKKFFLINQKEDLRGIFIHSKLALFDDHKAIIGSANFTKRSMNFDGEMSLFIESKDFCLNVKERLFKLDHNFNGIQTIVQDMKNFIESKELTKGIIPIKIKDLYMIKIPKVEKLIVKYLSLIVDQSDIF